MAGGSKRDRNTKSICRDLFLFGENKLSIHGALVGAEDFSCVIGSVFLSEFIPPFFL